MEEKTKVVYKVKKSTGKTVAIVILLLCLLTALLYIGYTEYQKLIQEDNTLVDDDENRKQAMEKILIERKEKVNSEKLERFIEIDNQFWKDRAEGKIKDPYKFKNNEEKTE